MATVVLQYVGSAIGSFIGGPIGGIIGRAAGVPFAWFTCGWCAPTYTVCSVPLFGGRASAGGETWPSCFPNPSEVVRAATRVPSPWQSTQLVDTGFAWRRPSMWVDGSTVVNV